VFLKNGGKWLKILMQLLVAKKKKKKLQTEQTTFYTMPKAGIVQLEPAKKKKSGDNNFLGSHFNVKYDFMITKRAHFKKKGKLLLKVDGAAVSVHADYPQQLVLGQAVL
jgi:hypothetical protein